LNEYRCAWQQKTEARKIASECHRRGLRVDTGSTSYHIGAQPQSLRGMR
jgi:hypothetical protein